MRLSIKGEHIVVARFIVLNKPRSPNAVGGFVISIVVLSVNCQLLRSWSHVSVKTLEPSLAVLAMKPPVANPDSSTAVVLPVDRLRVGAAIDDLAPDVVL